MYSNAFSFCSAFVHIQLTIPRTIHCNARRVCNASGTDICGRPTWRPIAPTLSSTAAVHTMFLRCVHPDSYWYFYCRIHSSIHACIHPCKHTYILACIHASMHPFMHASIHPCMHPSMHASIHAIKHASRHCTYPFMHISIDPCSGYYSLASIKELKSKEFLPAPVSAPLCLTSVTQCRIVKTKCKRQCLIYVRLRFR